MKTLLLGGLLLVLAGCLHGAPRWSDEAELKDYIAQQLDAKHARYTEHDLDRLYRKVTADAARAAELAQFRYWDLMGGPPVYYSAPSRPGIFDQALVPRRSMNCMQYGQLGQGGQFSCW